ncbi:MAG: hypothetical protein WCE94_07785 [Candidatus Methanoperedens sp.]
MIASKTCAGRALRIAVGITILVILLSGGAGAVPVEEWNKTFGGNNQDGAKYVQQTQDGGFIIAGDTKSFGAGGYDAWLIKTDYKGSEQWRKTFGGAGTDIVWSARQTSDGGYVVAGQTNSYGGKDQVWVFKTDGSGNQQWSKTFGGNYGDLANSVQQTSDGGYIIAAYSSSCTDSVKGSAWIIKTDNNGNQQWSKRFGGCGFDRADSLLQTSDGGYIFAGSTDSTETGAKGRTPWIVKIDSNGKWQWQQLESLGYEFTSIKQASDGGFILSGTLVPRGSYDKAWLYKTDSNGNKQWSKTFGSGGIFKGTSVQLTSDGGYALSAVVNPNAETTEDGVVYAGRSDSLLIKTNATGEKQWNLKLGKDGFDDIYSLQQTTDGGYILAGATDSYAVGWQDAWLVKVSNEITPVTLTVTASPSIITAGDPTGVTFTVTNILGMPQSGITVDLTGTATGSGTTDANGNVVINVNSPKAGATTATASKTGFISASTRISAIRAAGTLWVTATKSTIQAGAPVSVTFTVTNLAGVSGVGAKIELTGAATGSGTTDASGNVDITVNAANAGIITATASKFGFIGSNLTITAIKGTPTSTPTSTPTLVPTSVPTITSTATPPALAVTSNPATVIAGTATSVIFTVTSAGAKISGATITLAGAATGSGTTDAFGSVTLSVNAASSGVIIVKVSKTGLAGGNTTIIAKDSATPVGTVKSTILAPVTASQTIITLQGKLTNSGGDYVQKGSMKVTIYDLSGAQLWQETFDDVIDNGVFNIPLGAIQELKLIPDTVYQMEVAIDAESATYATPDVTFGDKEPASDVIKFKA